MRNTTLSFHSTDTLAQAEQTLQYSADVVKIKKYWIIMAAHYATLITTSAFYN